MMKTWVKALMIGTMALGPVAAFAAIDNTHHDIQYMGQGTEKCTYCHSKTGITASTGLGKVGGFCVAVCHISTAGLATPIPAVVPTATGTVTAYTFASGTGGTATKSANNATATIFTSGHGMTKSVLTTNFATEGAAVTATGWPYTAGDALQCTSCHSVHDAANPPFLNAKLTDGTQTGGFCQRCHNNAIRVQDFTTSGDHPTEFTWNPTAAAGRSAAKTGDAATIMRGRDIVIATGATNVNQTATNVANNAVAGALNGTTAAWNLGGHVLNTTTGLPQDGTTSTAGNDQFGCYSCHTVHIDQTATGVYGSSLVVAGGAAGTRIVCYVCHTLEPGVTGYGHPIDTETPLYVAQGWAAVPLTAGYTAINALYKPASGAPWCVSCHDVHGGIANRMAIRAIGALNTDGSVCELCHAGSYGNPTTADEHHPGAIGTDYTASAFPIQASWTTTDGHGDLNDGLSCPDCHVGDGTTTKRSTAHNWQ